MGAVDVCPFVPVAEVTMAEADGEPEAKDEDGDGQSDGSEQEADAGEHFWTRFRLGEPAAGAWSQIGTR